MPKSWAGRNRASYRSRRSYGTEIRGLMTPQELIRRASFTSYWPPRPFATKVNSSMYWCSRKILRTSAIRREVGAELGRRFPLLIGVTEGDERIVE